MKTTAFVTALFTASAMARPHDYCACQTSTDLAIAESATQRVLDNNPNTYKWGQDAGGTWYGHNSGSGPHFGGAFLQAQDGQIDGNDFHNACYLYGGNDSTCFDCDSWYTTGASGKDRVCTSG